LDKLVENLSAIGIGKEAEHLAADFLVEQGLKLQVSNYSCKVGELDLVMKDGNVLVFIEVRYRKDTGHGQGVESITQLKRQRIIRAATQYLVEKNLWDKVDCRFDVVTIDCDSAKSNMEWLKDAFWVKW
jgi:putative endonuclease